MEQLYGLYASIGCSEAHCGRMHVFDRVLRTTSTSFTENQPGDAKGGQPAVAGERLHRVQMSRLA
ncbi:MAG: hypothetical protein AAGF57_08340, partial [Pseudomonadota bacterium]